MQCRGCARPHCYREAQCAALVLWAHGDSPKSCPPHVPSCMGCWKARQGLIHHWVCGCWGVAAASAPGKTQHSSVTTTSLGCKASSLQLTLASVWLRRRCVLAAQEGSCCPASPSFLSGCLVQANVLGRKAGAIPAPCCSSGCKHAYRVGIRGLSGIMCSPARPEGRAFGMFHMQKKATTVTHVCRGVLPS